MELGSAVSAHRCSSYTATYTHCSIGFSPRVRTTSWIRAAAEGDDGGADRRRRGASFAADGPRVVEVTAAPVATSGGGAGGAAGSAGFGARDAELAMWDKLGAVVRLSYGIGIYGAMALTGRFICQMAGIDCTGGFHASLTALVEGLGYASPPIMALLFILDDEVVKYSPHARAIRDVEDEELRSFFYGMSPWQFILIVAASSVGEELFYRAAIQGALADIFLRSTELMKDARGIASLSGIVPPLVPFAQTFAAVITAALTGTLYYIATAPKDPTYVVTPATRSRTGRENLKKLFADNSNGSHKQFTPAINSQRARPPPLPGSSSTHAREPFQGLPAKMAAPASASPIGSPFCFSLSLPRSSVCRRCPLRLSRRAGVPAWTPVPGLLPPPLARRVSLRGRAPTACATRLSRGAGVPARTPVPGLLPPPLARRVAYAAVPRPRARPSTAEPGRSGICHRTTARWRPAPMSGLRPCIGEQHQPPPRVRPPGEPSSSDPGRRSARRRYWRGRNSRTGCPSTRPPMMTTSSDTMQPLQLFRTDTVPLKVG